MCLLFWQPSHMGYNPLSVKSTVTHVFHVHLIISHLLTKKLPDDIKALENNILDSFPNGRTDCFMKWKYGSLRASISKSKQMETTDSFTLLIISSFNN